MATDGGIRKEDIISDDALQAPLHMANNLEKASKAYEKVIDKTKELVRTNEKEEESITGLNDLLIKLTKQEEALVNLQNKHAIEVRKLIETQKKQEQEIDKLNKKLKEKQKIEEDSSKAIEALDARTGGWISSLKTLGKELGAIAKSPAILALGALVGTFYALKNAAETYYTTSGEGEDRLAEKIAASDAALNVIKNRWAEVGKAVVEAEKPQYGFWASLAQIGALWTGNHKLMLEMQEAGKKAVQITQDIDTLNEEIADHSIQRARDEREMAELIYKSKQKNLYSDKERLEFLTEAQSINKGLLQAETVFAERKVTNLEKEIALRVGVEESELRAMDAETLHARLLEPEYTKLAEAKANVIRADARFYEEEKKNAAAIAGLQKEIADERKRGREEAEKTAAEERKIQNAILERNQKIAQTEIDFQNEALENFKKNFKTMDEIRQEGLLGELEMLELLEYQKEIDFQADVQRWENLLQTAQTFGKALTDLFSTIFSRRLAHLDDEKKRLEEDAEGNKKQIEEVEKQRRAEVRKSAIYEKAAAFATASINIALAITKVLPNPLLVSLTAALGAIQLATILARPIPALFKGSPRFKGGPALIGERGPELVVTGSEAFLSPGKATVMDIPAGAMVVPAPETARILSGQRAGGGWDDSRIVGAIRETKAPDVIRRFQDIYEVRRYTDRSVQYTRRQIFPSER